jgi:hypothetical protein
MQGQGADKDMQEQTEIYYETANIFTEMFLCHQTAIV